MLASHPPESRALAITALPPRVRGLRLRVVLVQKMQGADRTVFFLGGLGSDGARGACRDYLRDAGAALILSYVSFGLKRDVGSAYLEGGHSSGEFLRQFPATREMAVESLQETVKKVSILITKALPSRAGTGNGKKPDQGVARYFRAVLQPARAAPTPRGDPIKAFAKAAIFVGGRVEREVPTVDDVDFGAWNIPAISFRPRLAQTMIRTCSPDYEELPVVFRAARPATSDRTPHWSGNRRKITADVGLAGPDSGNRTHRSRGVGLWRSTSGSSPT